MLKQRLHISTIDSRAHERALINGLGIEIAEFCWAQYLDVGRDEHIEISRRASEGIKSLWFHAPFAEISPCAIDPKVRALTRERYFESIDTAARLGIKHIVIHGGYIPHVYFPESYVEQSVIFWKDLLKDAPEDIIIALENVMEPSPDMLVEIVNTVNDPRLGLCLDIGHANCSVSEVKPLYWVEPMSKKLLHVHLHDNLGVSDTHLALGEGLIPIESIIKKVLALAPSASFTIENMDSDGSIRWLKERGFLDD